MKIAMFSDSFFPVMGGREKVIDYSLQEIINNGHEAFLCAPKNKNEVMKDFKDESLKYKVYRCNSIKLAPAVYYSACNLGFRKKVEKEKFDIIHCQTKYLLLNYAFRLRKKFNVPVVTTVHTNYINVYKSLPKFIRKIALKFVVRQMNKCDKVFAVSHFMKEQVKSLGVKTDIVVIKNGTIFRDVEYIDKSEIFKKYQIEEDTFLLLYVGRIIKEKNLEFQLRTIQRLKEMTNKKFCLLYVGGGEDKVFEELKNLSKELNVEKYVKFVGQVTDINLLYSIYKSADLFFFSSTTDNDPLVLVEAAYNKTPSIIIENTSGEERIQNEFNGFVAKNNEDDMAKKIAEMMDGKYDLEKISENAKMTIPKSWNEVTKLYLEEYEKVIKEFKMKNAEKQKSKILKGNLKQKSTA